jgi:mycothiol synthase
MRAALAEAASNGGGQVVLWVERVDALLDAAARAAGLTPWRNLLQLRRSLPARPSALRTRPFTQHDTDALLRVNNRAFSWHPEQGGWTQDDLSQRFAEPWFHADGLRIYEASGQVKPPTAVL